MDTNLPNPRSPPTPASSICPTAAVPRRSSSTTSRAATTLYNPTNLALDSADNLAFFIENDTFSGGTGTAELDVGTLTGHNFAPLLTIPVGAYNTSYEINTSLAIDPTTDTLYFATGQFGTTSADGIYSVHYTPGGTLATVGSTSTLYTGAAAQDPYALAVDAANNLLFVTGTTIGNSGSSDAASAWVGSTSAGATLSEISSSAARPWTTIPTPTRRSSRPRPASVPADR